VNEGESAELRRTSLGLRSRPLLRFLIERTARGRFGPYITPQTDERRRDPAEGLASGKRELEDGPSIFTRFAGGFGSSDLRGRRVLDVGCGYGGRTVYYARECGAAEAVGVEVTEEQVRRSRLLAEQLDVTNAAFELGTAEELPFEDGSFDAVVSYDVLEHVDDPAAALAETARVLREDGSAWLVFPTYLGARSSHLDYLTLLPALHRVFDPATIIEVVNEQLARRPELRTPAQPPPHVGPFGRAVLPKLNGLAYADTRPLLRRAGLEVVQETVTPILDPESKLPLGGRLSRVLSAWHERRGLPEILIGSIAIRARRSGPASPRTVASD
jgi:SAM-dependent methyltransferase